MIDADGYRPNVAIVLARPDGRVFWARRARQDGWQFPQGGMNTDETPEDAMFRELTEETGLTAGHVKVVGSTPGWLRYRLPRRFRRHNQKPVCIGQKQVWFLLEFLADDSVFRFDMTESPEFDQYRWVDFWYPVRHVIPFKRRVYARALRHLEPMLDALSGPRGGERVDSTR